MIHPREHASRSSSALDGVGRGTTRALETVRWLVAVRDDEPGDALTPHPVEMFDLPGSWGLPPADGDPVGIPVPCARARAGYWCECTGSFRSVRGHVPMSRARVELLTRAAATSAGVPFIWGPPSEQWVPEPTAAEEAMIVRMLHRWPIGTIVERRGLGFAPVYRPTRTHPVPPVPDEERDLPAHDAPATSGRAIGPGR